MKLRTKLLKALREETPVNVAFTKADGSRRDMVCSLHDNHIPGNMIPKGTKELPENDEVIRVFDVENKGWRSFRVESVISWSA